MYCHSTRKHKKTRSTARCDFNHSPTTRCHTSTVLGSRSFPPRQPGVRTPTVLESRPTPRKLISASPGPSSGGVGTAKRTTEGTHGGIRDATYRSWYTTLTTKKVNTSQYDSYLPRDVSRSFTTSAKTIGGLWVHYSSYGLSQPTSCSAFDYVCFQPASSAQEGRRRTTLEACFSFFFFSSFSFSLVTGLRPLDYKRGGRVSIEGHGSINLERDISTKTLRIRAHSSSELTFTETWDRFPSLARL